MNAGSLYGKTSLGYLGLIEAPAVVSRVSNKKSVVAMLYHTRVTAERRMLQFLF